MIGRPLLVTSALLALAATPFVARADEDIPALLKIINDEGQPLEKRQEALERGVAWIARQPLPHTGPLKDALGPLLDRAIPRRADPALTRWITVLLRSTEVFQPFDGMAGRLRPLLARDAPPALRKEALRTIQLHGVQGLAPELEAYMREGGADPQRQGLERSMLDAAVKLPTAECVRVAVAALEASSFRGVRTVAARTLGEVRSDTGRRALLKIAAVEEREEAVACEAALALGRHGTLEGAPLLIERLKVKQGTIVVYRALCRLTMREVEGFGGVLPDSYNEAGKEGRAAAIAAASAWWDTARTRTRDDVLFDALKARGVNVPADRRGKESISALIEALTVEPSSLRYAALDLLVERTGKTDLAENFRVLQRSLRGTAAMREPEPVDGFQDEMRKEALKQQQAEKQARWRAWWDSAKNRAENVNGKWIVRGEPRHVIRARSANAGA